MGIFSRISDIATANVIDMVERAENPTKMVGMIIAEMEDAQIAARAYAASTIADQKEKRRQIEAIELAEARWTSKAKVALENGREDLATAALTEREKGVEAVAKMQLEIAALDKLLATNEADLATLTEKLKEARTRQVALIKRNETAQTQLQVRKAGAGLDAAMSRFEILEQRADFAEARADSYLVGSETKSLEKELDDLDIAARAASGVAALKASMAKKK